MKVAEFGDQFTLGCGWCQASRHRELTFTAISSDTFSIANRVINASGERDPFPPMEICRLGGDRRLTMIQDPSWGQAAFSLAPTPFGHQFETLTLSGAS
jgi:hypothetical protein